MVNEVVDSLADLWLVVNAKFTNSDTLPVVKHWLATRMFVPRVDDAGIARLTSNLRDMIPSLGDELTKRLRDLNRGLYDFALPVLEDALVLQVSVARDVEDTAETDFDEIGAGIFKALIEDCRNANAAQTDAAIRVLCDTILAAHAQRSSKIDSIADVVRSELHLRDSFPEMFEELSKKLSIQQDVIDDKLRMKAEDAIATIPDFVRRLRNMLSRDRGDLNAPGAGEDLTDAATEVEDTIPEEDPRLDHDTLLRMKDRDRYGWMQAAAAVSSGRAVAKGGKRRRSRRSRRSQKSRRTKSSKSSKRGMRRQ